ncbi:MAG TPA: hypothetical protein VIV60_26435 [Polyangiaceae bacterium]
MGFFVGAGVSMIAPTCLPSWWQVNHAVLDALAQRKCGLHPNVMRVIAALGNALSWVVLGYSGADLEADPGFLGAGANLPWPAVAGAAGADAFASGEHDVRGASRGPRAHLIR